MHKEMKLHGLILFVFIVCNLKAQTPELVKFERSQSYKKDCSIIKNCIESIGLNNQTLILTLYTWKPVNSIERCLEYRIANDTFFIDYLQSNKNEAILYMESSKKCEVLNFEFKEFTKVPNCISYNSDNLSTCPIEYFSYNIYKGDTINIINRNGYKDGKWIDFLESGVTKIKEYNNGRFIKGYLYDKSGKITHVVSDEGVEVSIPIDFYNATH
jgi:hypothetical protein